MGIRLENVKCYFLSFQRMIVKKTNRFYKRDLIETKSKRS